MGADHDDVLDDPDGGLVWPEIETAISFDEMTISTGASVPVFIVRPAWAHTCGCKSRCELVTVSKVKRNCVRVTERGEEAWSVNRELMNKNCIEGTARQGEWAIDHEALVTKAWAA